MMLSGRKIVAIDDTKSILTFLRVSLEDEGADFFAASTAAEGLRLCERVVPDLVVLDLGLPDEDGLDVLPKIKALFPGYAPKVIVLSVRKDNQTIAQARASGANDYLSKPFMVEDLLERVEAVIQ
jgi:DNA-binding response OmpR family regulator